MPNYLKGPKVCLFAFLWCCSNSWAVSNTIHFQGRLTDNQGAPIVGPDVSVKFSLYSLASGGNLLWDAGVEQPVATNSAGLFSTDIGPVPLNVFSDNSDLYLQVAVRGTNGLKSLSPRQKLSSVPYAFQANTATFAASAGTATAVASQSISSDKIQKGAVTANELGTNSVNSSHIVDGSIAAVDLSTQVKGFLIPSGLIAMFDAACPSGWTRFDQLDNRFPMGAPSYSGNPGGHNTLPEISVSTAGSHSHSIPAHSHGAGALKAPLTSWRGYVGADGSWNVKTTEDIQGNTDAVTLNTSSTSNHTHTLIYDRSWIPSYLGVVFCRKD